jgi:hypothetical protein
MSISPPEAQRYSTINGAKSKAYYGFSVLSRLATSLDFDPQPRRQTPFDPRFDPVNFSASPNSLSSMITVSFRDQFIPA